MIVTKKTAARIKRLCGQLCEVGCFYDDEIEESDEDNIGFNCLHVSDETRDLDTMMEPDDMVGMDIPDREGFVLFDVYCYERSGMLHGNQYLLLNRRGQVIWHTLNIHRLTYPDDKVGEVVARHFGLIATP